MLASDFKSLKAGCNLKQGYRDSDLKASPEYSAPEEKGFLQKNFIDYKIDQGINQ